MNNKYNIEKFINSISASHILCVIFLSFLIFYVGYSFVLSNTIKTKDEQIESLMDRLEIEENALTLEYSIGYWFIHTPKEVNDSLLYNLLKDNGAWYPEILVKQAKIESGNYKSGLFKNSNNLYGMKIVGKRNTTQVGNYNGYGLYGNWCLSALDRLLWDEFRFKGIKPTKEEYLKAMSIYAETDSYHMIINGAKLDINVPKHSNSNKK